MMFQLKRSICESFQKDYEECLFCICRVAKNMRRIFNAKGKKISRKDGQIKTKTPAGKKRGEIKYFLERLGMIELEKLKIVFLK